MTKSHVSMEQQQCIVCCETFDTGAILLDRRMRNSLERHTLTGIGMCPACEEQKGKGFVALIEGDIIGMPDETNVKIDEVTRSGTRVWLKIEAYEQIFNVPLPPKGIAYIEKGVVEKIQEIVDAQPVS